MRLCRNLKSNSFGFGDNRISLNLNKIFYFSVDNTHFLDYIPSNFTSLVEGRGIFTLAFFFGFKTAKTEAN